MPTPATSLQVERFHTRDSCFELDRTQHHTTGRVRLTHVGPAGVSRFWVDPHELEHLRFDRTNTIAVLTDDGMPSLLECGPVRRVGGKVTPRS